MTTGLQTLRDERNRVVHQAREIVSRPHVTREDEAHADRLLSRAGEIDDQIRQERGRMQGRREGLALARDLPTPGAGVATPWKGRKLFLRPGSKEELRSRPEYEDAFRRYLLGSPGVNGDTPVERLGLQASDMARGGALAPISFVAQIAGTLDDTVTMRRLGTVLPVMAGQAVEVPGWERTAGTDATWSAEVPASDIAEGDDELYSGRTLTPHLLCRMVKASKKFVQSTGLDPEQFIAERLAARLAAPQEQAFMTGSGSGEPLGVFTTSDAGVGTDRDTTASGATTFTGDNVIACAASLREVYLRRSTWLISREFLRRCRTLKDGNSQYIWQAGLGGAPDLLCDRPYELSEFCPATFTAGQPVAVLGDISRYWIADSLAFEVQVLVELFGLKNQIGYVARAEVDGMPVTGEAFARLKMGT